MSYTSKLRLLLIVIALLPPLVIISILKFSTESEIGLEQCKSVEHSFEKAESFLLSEQGRVRYNVQELSKDSLFLKLLSAKKKTLQDRKEIFDKYNFDILYITDNFGSVLYSFGNLSPAKSSLADIKEIQNKNHLTKETDLQGTHASLTFVAQVDSLHFLYAGRYIDQSLSYLLESISDASVSIDYNQLNLPDKIGKIQELENGYKAILRSSLRDSVSISLTFAKDSRGDLFATVLQIILIVTFGIIVLTILLGLYLTGKTKKEIDNLRIAFASVADGNFNTTIMAYEKSEFSELADSFSEMLTKLKKTQAKLLTVEKIAAWETVGRKLAHEIKNPLTPISIAADDLRSSYYEKLPNFETTIDETTTTIKKEVKRMTLLLDEFVSFARMKQSELHDVEFTAFMYDLQKLYTKEIAGNKLVIKSNIDKIIIKLDKDTCTQLFINLIKNGFESKKDATVEISISRIEDILQILITDDGPGFSEAKLKNSFTPFETTKENGSGLGLIICHRIVLDHNGNMTLQNRINGGGEVLITLPIQ